MMNVAAMLLVMDNPRGSGVDCGKHPAKWKHIVRNRLPTALVLGVLGGGAAGVKLTGLAVLVVPLAWYLVTRARPLLPAVYVLTAAAVAFPFYLRPWLLTGDPFYPYYCQWFPADLARLEMSRYHHALGAAFGLHDSPASWAGGFLLAFDQRSLRWRLWLATADLHRTGGFRAGFGPPPADVAAGDLARHCIGLAVRLLVIHGPAGPLRDSSGAEPVASGRTGSAPSAWPQQEARPRGARVCRPHQHPVANDGALFRLLACGPRPHQHSRLRQRFDRQALCPLAGRHRRAHPRRCQADAALRAPRLLCAAQLRDRHAAVSRVVLHAARIV